jgi:hypothetical protein
MFREVAIATLTITGLGIVLHALIARGVKMAVPSTGTACPWGRLIRGGAAVMVLACSLGLAITGLYSRLVLDTALAGYLLIAHVSLGGAFVAALAVFAVTWASDHWDLPGRRVRKGAFWLMVIVAIPMVLAVLLNMFPVFGTEWQGELVNIHRYSALACTACGIIWGYLTVRRVNS